jgi:hypothetical protein
MDPDLQTLSIQLAEAAIRNTAGTVADRITVAKARRRDQETVTELEEIVNGLLSDKAELVRIAQAYEQELVAQRISQTDIKYISASFTPLIRRLVEAGVASGDGDSGSVDEILSLIQPLLSVETVTVLQLIGFNFKKAIGEPLTDLVSRLILSKAAVDPSVRLEIERLNLVRETNYLEIARDPEAAGRLGLQAEQE